MEPPSVLDTFRKTFYLVGRDNPARWVALVLGAVAVSGLEMLGAVLIYLLLAMIADPGGELTVPLLGDLRDLMGDVDEPDFLVWAAVGLSVFFVLRAAFQISYSYVKHRLAVNAGARLSTRLVQGYLRLPYQSHLGRSSSELVRNAHQTVEKLTQQCFLPVITVLAEVLLITGLLVVMVAVAPVATAGAVVIVGSAAVVLLTVVQPRLKALGSEAQQLRAITLATLQQALYGIRDIKVLGAEEHFAGNYRGQYERLARTSYLRGVYLDLPRLVIETTLVLFILTLFAVSVAGGTPTQELLSLLGLFAYVGLRIQPSLQRLVAGLNNVKFSGAAVDDIYDDLLMLDDLPAADNAQALEFTGEVRFEDVSFTYDGASRPALNNVALRIAAGERIGICGPTGGGKSTLADLLVGLLEPTNGRVTIDGVDIQERRAAWFANLGVVSQSVFLLDDTLRHNIALGVPDEEVDDAAVRRAMELAQLHAVVDELPAGLDTMIGERGLRLSGGQRQRVAIARALYRDPRVLILDEGTSALDHETEAVLVRAIEGLGGCRTLVMIAHRLSTLQRCDRIVLVADSRISGTGTFAELSLGGAGFLGHSTKTGQTESPTSGLQVEE